MNPIVVVLMIVCSIISAAVASGKNRNVAGWVVCGALFPLIAVIAISCLPPLPSADELALRRSGQ